MKAKTEVRPAYVQPVSREVSEDTIIAEALRILERRLYRKPENQTDTPAAARRYLVMKLAELEHEVFGVIWLDVRHSVLRVDELFRGTLTETIVYPREVIKAGVACNACSAIFYHNHPSGNPDASEPDKCLTSTLQNVLNMLNIRVLDHLIVAGTQTSSFAELGLL